jgi:hypothetical protein
MDAQPESLLGGPSVFCINAHQMAEAERLAYDDPVTAPCIHAELDRLEQRLTRNERAALAFILIQRLRGSAD